MIAAKTNLIRKNSNLNQMQKSKLCSYKQNYSLLTKSISAAMSVALALGAACPAFGQNLNGETNLDETLSVPANVSEITSGSYIPPIASGIVDLVPVGTAIPETSIVVSVQTTIADDASEDDNEAAEQPEDKELCNWSYDGTTWSTMRGGSPMTITNAIGFGIDVSEWQHQIDWAKVKASGVQFAILRASYGSASTGREDLWFAKNVEGCKANGIAFGVYVYSNNTTFAGGQAEADFALDIMSRAGVVPTDLMFPVYIDIEDEAHKTISAASRADLAEGFCNTISAAGFQPGIYASQSWFEKKLTDVRFLNWTKWVASYPSTGVQGATTNYKSTHDMWQCMSRGVIDGIETRVDINFDYRFSEGYYAAVYNYEYYLQKNPDVAALYGTNRTAAFLHFLRQGMAEGRQANETFFPLGYFNSNIDLRQAYGLDLKKYYEHYMSGGINENRSMSDWLFPTGLSLKVHLLDMSSIYDTFTYLRRYPDLSERYTLRSPLGLYVDDVSLFSHFLSTGIDEGRQAK